MTKLTLAAGERIKRAYAEEENRDDPRRAEVLETGIVPADTTFSSAVVLDLGDRQVELVHPGRGHTAGDLVVRVPDADVLLAGDLVEERRRQVGDLAALPLGAPRPLAALLGHDAAGEAAPLGGERDRLAALHQRDLAQLGRGAAAQPHGVERQEHRIGLVGHGWPTYAAVQSTR